MNWFAHILTAGVLFICSAQTENKTVPASIQEEPELEMEIVSEEAEGELPEDSLSPIEKMPELTFFAKADFPSELVKNGIEGNVLLELTINEQGSVDSVSVIKSLHPILDSTAARAAYSFKFTPAIAGGDSVSVLLQYEYRFSIDEVVSVPEEYINFKGMLIERGTRRAVKDALVVVSFPDSICDSSLQIPIKYYLQKIGKIPGQILEDNKLIYTTDSTGEFKFSSLPSCSIDVSIIVSGYEEFKTREFIASKEELAVRYFLTRTSYTDYEIVVYGKAEEKEVSRRQLDVQEIRKIPGLGGDALRVVQTMAGVSRPTLGSGEIIVRGTPSWDSRYYLDGVELPVLFHFGGLKSVYNSEALQSIDFYPGGFGTRYGGAIGGVIEINSREVKRDRWHLMADYSTIDGSIFIEGPVTEKLSVMVSGRRSIIGNILGLITKMAGDRMPFTIAPFYWDYLGKGDLKLNKNNDFSFTLFGSRDSLAFIYPKMRIGSDEISEQTDRMGMNSTFHMGKLGWDWSPQTRLSNSAQYSLMWYGENYSVFGYMKIESRIWLHHIRDEFKCKIGERSSINAGIDAQFISDDFIMVLPGSNNSINRDTTENWEFGVMGAYLNFEWKPFENVSIIPGLRYDYFPELNYDGSHLPAFWNYHAFDNNRGYSGEPSLRVNGRYEFIEDHTLKAAVGNYSQTPEPMGWVIHKTWGNPELPTTKAAHYVAGYEWQITDIINADVQIYYNNQWDIPEMVSADGLSTASGVNNSWLNSGKGRMYGLEIMLRHLQSERFFGWLAYTLSRSERYDQVHKKWVLFDDDETHHLQVLGSWHLKKNFDAGFRLRYVQGKPTTPIVGITENENLNGAMSIKPNYGDKNSKRINPFFGLDLKVDKKLVFDKWMFTIYADLQNISWLVYKSPETEFYNYDYTDKTTFSMFPMLSIGCKAEF